MSEAHAPGPGVARHYLHEHEDVRAEDPADGMVLTWNESTQSADFAVGAFVTPDTPPDVTGSRANTEQALANLLTALDGLGIITDSTTA